MSANAQLYSMEHWEKTVDTGKSLVRFREPTDDNFHRNFWNTSTEKPNVIELNQKFIATVRTGLA